MIGLSGGGGEPLCARVVDVEAVELIRFTELGFGTRNSLAGIGAAEEVSPGGGQYC